MRGLLLAAPLMGVLTMGWKTPSSDRQLFQERVWPILKEHCLKCHGGERIRGGLDVSSRADLLQGGDHGPAIVPGNPERSLLIRSVRFQGDYPMPPKGKLRTEQVADLAEWVKRGAPWPGR